MKCKEEFQTKGFLKDEHVERRMLNGSTTFESNEKRYQNLCYNKDGAPKTLEELSTLDSVDWCMCWYEVLANGRVFMRKNIRGDVLGPYDARCRSWWKKAIEDKTKVHILSYLSTDEGSVDISFCRFTDV